MCEFLEIDFKKPNKNKIVKVHSRCPHCGTQDINLLKSTYVCGYSKGTSWSPSVGNYVGYETRCKAKKW